MNPATDEVLVIEMNPRVSRSSALASKATGFPIAKIAARLAVGYTLDEIDNDITRLTPAAFEPTLDYVVVKWPRFAFEKFSGADAELTTHMKSVGEAMAVGRTFGQAFAKAMRSRELDAEADLTPATEALLDGLRTPGPERFDAILEVLRRGVGVDAVGAGCTAMRKSKVSPSQATEGSWSLARSLRHCRSTAGPSRRAAYSSRASPPAARPTQAGPAAGFPSAGRTR